MTVIGVLALQGDVEEHVECISQLGVSSKKIKLPEDLLGLDGVIIPGGESTSIAILAQRCGLLPALKEWVHSGKPIWGTCAGMILLANEVLGQAAGQRVIGGLDAQVRRNFFGPQLFSCEVELSLTSAGERLLCKFPDEEERHHSFKAVLIRAPAVLKVGADVEILAQARMPNESNVVVTVAARDRNILVTSFHPELTKDLRWHKAFLQMVETVESE